MKTILLTSSILAFLALIAVDFQVALAVPNPPVLLRGFAAAFCAGLGYFAWRSDRRENSLG